ncbi:PLDc_N domain-containing protein [Nesterenkonia sp. E16_7]|uniref:PLDc N-terminal domain-containing protein n=1 Tax=unclassified Nesterenkonia TaxID=2629769 RepID=UPI001A920EA2|nr:PLDc_N domain-containing protein [Nesterenkonia sp. E16_10]MBO0597820.1 PLDc_N domain-containing protein [Nesterenkonia sp. E16_7]
MTADEDGEVPGVDRNSIGSAIEYGGGALLLVLSLVAVISVVRSPVHSVKAKMLWAVFAVVIPLAGPVVWFFVGRETAEQKRLRAPAH